MQQDIQQKIEQDFGIRSHEAIGLLKNFEAENNLSPRVSRCIVHLSNGNLDELKKNIQLARIDWRDLINHAESKKFEFNEPFNLEL